MGDLVFDLSPAQSAYVHTDAHIAMLIGSMGEGKTYASAIALPRHAQRCGMDIRGALIRDTHQNLKISTVPDLNDIFKGLATFHDDCKKMVVHTTPKVEMDLFGIDDPTALSKLQGPQYAIIWLEEPAPIIDKQNAGLPKEVFDLAIARASRQAGTIIRVQISQNPADEDHWTEAVANEPEIYAYDEETKLALIKKVFRISYGENKYLNPLARLANKAAFKNDPGKYARYVEGRAAPVQLGKRVLPEYNPKIHFSETILPVLPGVLGVRGWDAWHHPCCGIGQFIAPGKLWIHDVVTGEGIGTKELIEQKVLPLLNTPKYKGKIGDWRDIGDPSMRTPDQSSVNRTTAKVLERALDTRFEPGPTRWASRINPTKTALTSLATDGSPMILISKSAYNLHRALNGGWHWKTDNSGNIVGNMPDKDQYSHYGDMFTYLVSVLFPYARGIVLPRNYSRQKQMTRAMSYASGFSSPQAIRSRVH